MNLKPGLETPSERIAQLPVDHRGYPIPWFVAEVDGKPDFRVMDPNKWVLAVTKKLCWVCGQRMGSFKTFVIGPMCGINRTTGEPPVHLECGQWSARNCPFLANPNMVRREDELIKSLEGESAGIMIKRNPGVTLVWTTKGFRIFNDGHGKPLIQIGEPTSIEWYAKGQIATREQVIESVESGCPFLLKMATEDGPEALGLYNRLKADLETMYPAAQ